MAIKVLNRDELAKYKLDAEFIQLKKLEREVVEQIKLSMKMFVDIESIYELKDHIDNIVSDWHEYVVEGEEDED